MNVPEVSLGLLTTPDSGLVEMLEAPVVIPKLLAFMNSLRFNELLPSGLAIAR